MKEKILNRLKRIEKDHQVKIIYAVESGSRAWGFESPDSDWDIRFIYLHDYKWYLSLKAKRDVIELMEEPLDFSGWDLTKALKLLKKSNAHLIEWLNSPIIYIEEKEIVDKLREISKRFLNLKSLMYHYYHLARRNYYDYLEKPEVNLKKYFYVLRTISACEWIKNYKTNPPVRFEELLSGVLFDEKVKNEILKLLQKKRKKSELGKGKKIEIINNYIKEKVLFFDEYLKNMDVKVHLDDDLLDELFLFSIKKIFGKSI